MRRLDPDGPASLWLGTVLTLAAMMLAGILWSLR